MNWTDEFKSIVGGNEIYDTTLISSTNNLVYRVSCDCGVFVVKIIQDFPIKGEQIQACANALKEKLPIQHVVGMADIPSSGTEIVVTTYYSGENVASLIEAGKFSLEREEKFTVFLVQMLSLLPEFLPKSGHGFGKYKRKSQLSLSVKEHLLSESEKYCTRLANIQPKDSIWVSLKKTLQSKILEFHKSEIFVPAACSFDMNLKNFLLTENEEFMILNFPIIGFLDPMMSVAATAANTIGSSVLRQRLIEKFVQTETDRKKFLLFETIILLGHLSAAAGNSSDDIDSACAWGWKANFKEQISSRYPEMSS